MSSPPREQSDAGTAGAGPLDELAVAVRAGRLVALLKGEGLNRSTIEELLQPRGLSALKAILSDRLYPEADDSRTEER